jgi:uncharacterized protein
MKDRGLIERVESYLKREFLDRGDAHDYWHMMRVYKLAREICMAEEGDLQIVSLAALLHDVADHKFLVSGETEEGKLAEVLDELEIFGDTRERIEEIILNLSYKGGTNRYEFDHLEGKIVRDADRLDSIGAIGVGRAFAYGGSRDRSMYDPMDKPKEFKSLQEYKKNNGSTINHFYEKLLKLRDGFYTETARKRAVRRHEFMEEFLREFLLEWEGKA